jgi:hypothetical protein
MLAFLLRLLLIVLLARLFVAVFRYLKGPRRPSRRTKQPPAMPPHLGKDIVDAEFEDVRPEREP